MWIAERLTPMELFTGVCIGVLAVLALLAVIAIPSYLLVSLPLLSFKQGAPFTDCGTVTEIQKIRPGVIVAALTAPMAAGPRMTAARGGTKVLLASSTNFIYFRSWQHLPELGSSIEVITQNRLHRFTGMSCDWVSYWKLVADVPPRGRIVPAGGEGPGMIDG